MMNSTFAHIHTSDTHCDPSFFPSHTDIYHSRLAQAEGLISGDKMLSTEEYGSTLNELVTPWLSWNYGGTTEWIGLIPSSVQSNLCVDPRLIIEEPEAMARPPLASGSSHEAYQYDAGMNIKPMCLQETSVLDEGSVDSSMVTTIVGGNLELNPESTEVEPWVGTHGIRSAKSGGKWRSEVGLSEEMTKNKIVILGSAIPSKRRAPRTKAPRVGVIWVEEDDGQEPDLERDSLGYATPTAALDRLTRGRIKVERMDRVFFPPTQKHTKSPTRGHICHVQRKIVHQGQGQVVWAPVVTGCQPQKTADSYKRHLLNCHLAMPRAYGKRCNAKEPLTRMVATPTRNANDYGMGHTHQSSTEGSIVRKRKRGIEDEGASHSQGEPSARNHSKHPRIA